jgi:uracil-DNA glycosylase family 4
LLQKPDTCSACPLFTKGQGFVPDAIVPQPEYVFIGEAPGGNEVEQGAPFVGQAGFVLKQWLMRAVPQIQLAAERNRITIANTLRCLPPMVQGRPYPKGEEKLLAERCCSQYDNLGDARTVVLFGENAQRKWFGPELEAEDASDRQLQHSLKGTMGRIGRVYNRDGKRWVFNVHPAFILRQPSLVEHGQQALRIAAGVDKVLEVEYAEWNDAIQTVF